MLRNIFIVLAVVAAAATAQFHLKDLTTKTGSTLFTASYINNANDKMTRGRFTGTWTLPNGNTEPINSAVITAYYTFTVNDKHGKPLNWKNVMDSQVTELPNNITNNFVDGKNLFSQHFMLTSLDQNSGALLGSIVWGGTWACRSINTLILGPQTMVYPVYGATGVYKSVKTVRIDFNEDFSRSIRFLKTAL